MSPAGEFAASLWGCAYLADCPPPPPCAEPELWLPRPLSDIPATITWCAERDHPWLTYNPHMDRTWCRCGQRQAAGERPHDWDADWELFHDHPRGAPCSCYVRAAHYHDAEPDTACRCGKPGTYARQALSLLEG